MLEASWFLTVARRLRSSDCWTRSVTATRLLSFALLGIEGPKTPKPSEAPLVFERRCTDWPFLLTFTLLVPGFRIDTDSCKKAFSGSCAAMRSRTRI